MMILIQDNVSQQLSRNRLILTQHARSLYENSNTSLDDSETMRKLRQVQGLELSIPNTVRNVKCVNLRLGKGKANEVVLHVTFVQGDAHGGAVTQSGRVAVGSRKIIIENTKTEQYFDPADCCICFRFVLLSYRKRIPKMPVVNPEKLVALQRNPEGIRNVGLDGGASLYSR